MNILIIHSSSYTQKMIQYFLSHYSPNIQTCTLQLQPPPSKTDSLDLIFVDYETSHQETYLQVLKKIQILAPIILIHDDATPKPSKEVTDCCKGFLKKPIESQALQKITNQLVQHTQDLKLNPYLKFFEPLKNSSFEVPGESLTNHLEIKDPLPISGALDEDIHTLLTDQKDITQLKNSTNILKKITPSFKEEEKIDPIIPNDSNSKEKENPTLQSDNKRIQKNIPLHLDINEQSSSLTSEPSSLSGSKAEKNIVISQKENDSNSKEKENPTLQSDNKRIQKNIPLHLDINEQSSSLTSEPSSLSGSKAETNIVISQKENDSNSKEKENPTLQWVQTNKVIDQQSSSLTSEPSSLSGSKAETNIVISQKENDSNSKEKENPTLQWVQTNKVIDQQSSSLTSEPSSLSGSKAETNIVISQKESSFLKQASHTHQVAEDLSDIIDQKLKTKWNQILENQIKKELHQMIDNAVSKIFKEQLKEILTQKGVQSIKEISLEIIPEVSKQIVRKEIRKLIEESSKTNTS